MSPEQEATQSNAEATEETTTSLLDDIVTETKIGGRDTDQRNEAKAQISALVREVMSNKITVSQDLEEMINQRIGEIDRLLSSQLNAIMHEEPFQKLEGAWRGLNYLVMQSETGPMLKIKVLNVTKKDLLKDLQKAKEFDQSTLFKKVYEEEFGTFGGHPFGALIGDYEFGTHPEDMALLERISNVAAAAHAPFLSAANADMFGLESFTDLPNPRDLSQKFESAKYIQWKSFRDSEDSRFVGLTLPHILMRLPYGPDTTPIESFTYKEDVDGKDHKKYLWGNAAYAMGTRLTTAFAKYSWCAAIRGVEGGGLVEGLPSHTFNTDEGELVQKCPTEIAITDRRENELAQLGFIPLIHCKGSDVAAFFGAQSCQKPQKFDTPEANANAKLSSQLQYLMATSRFAHYLKAMMRDKIGAFMTRDDCEKYLNRWIKNYVVSTEDATQEVKARRPLKEARIDVSEIPGKPGCYKAVAFLKPHFQLDEISVSLRLVADLPPPAK